MNREKAEQQAERIRATGAEVTIRQYAFADEYYLIVNDTGRLMVMESGERIDRYIREHRTDDHPEAGRTQVEDPDGRTHGGP